MKKSKKIEMLDIEGNMGDRVNSSLVPVIDISLVLVIVFSALCPMALTSGIRALESQSSSGKGKTAKKENVEVILAKDKVITVNNIKVNLPAWTDQASTKGLENILLEEISKSGTKVVMLTADKENIVNDVVKILDTAKQSGAKKVIIMSKKVEKKVEKRD
ncbi:MAG: biopolymer transporter ExbD [Elusimicrobiota bacterium]